MLGAEQIEQIKIFDWIRSKPELKPYSLHIANERRTTPQHGKILKRLGVRSGASDVFIGIARGRWHGLFLELKVGTNTPTEAQEQFMLDMTSQDYYCVWCRGFEEAKLIIQRYLDLEKPSCVEPTPSNPTLESDAMAK